MLGRETYDFVNHSTTVNLEVELDLVGRSTVPNTGIRMPKENPGQH